MTNRLSAIKDGDIEAAVLMDDVDAAALHLQTIAGITDGGICSLYLDPEMWAERDESTQTIDYSGREHAIKQWLEHERAYDIPDLRVTVGLVGEEPVETSFENFLRDNYCDEDEAREIERCLREQGAYHGGGGAAAEFVVTMKPHRPHGVFPRYDLDTLPAIPADWQDCSWHNDACPSFEAPNGLIVFVDYADVSERETGPCLRYSITRSYGDPDADLLATDDWSEVLAAVAAYQPNPEETGEPK